MKDIDHMIAVLQAAKEGKTIQSRYRRQEYSDWIDVAGSNMWYWYAFDYRVKPEPRRVWLNIREDVMPGVYTSREQADLYSNSYGRTECVEFVEVVK